MSAIIPKINPFTILPTLDPVIPGINAEMISQTPEIRTIHPATFGPLSINIPVIRKTIPTIKKSAKLAPLWETMPGISEATISHIAKIKVNQPFQLMNTTSL